MKTSSIGVKKSRERGEHQDAAPLAADLERNTEVRLHAESFLDAAELVGVGLQVARPEQLPCREHAHDASAVGQRQHVEPEHLLLVGERLRARAERDERVARLVEE